MRNYKKHSNARSVGWNEYHFEWCTKYRYKIFSNTKYKNLCEIFIKECCKRYKLVLQEYEVDLDHIHILVSLHLTMTPVQAVKYLKGYISKCMFMCCPELRKTYYGGHLWSPSKFIGSVGHITLEKAKEYIEKHHLK
jgi:putative transposase